jgi:hypothetical protein
MPHGYNTLGMCRLEILTAISHNVYQATVFLNRTPSARVLAAVFYGSSDPQVCSAF